MEIIIKLKIGMYFQIYYIQKYTYNIIISRRQSLTNINQTIYFKKRSKRTNKNTRKKKLKKKMMFRQHL